jgi:hypothetical protein
MGTKGRSQQVMGLPHGTGPVPESFADRILERPAAELHGIHLRPQKLHAKNIEGLTANVLRSHVNLALKPQACGHRRSGNPVLAGSGFRDKTALSHPGGQKPLPHGIGNLVGSRMIQIFPLEPDTGSPGLLRKGKRRVERGGASGVVGKHP